MRPSVCVVHDLVSEIRPADAEEAEYRTKTFSWLESTDDVFRRAAGQPGHSC
jgi:hypothetical protein